MATFQDRLEKTRQYVMDEDVTVREAYAHVYLWLRFELAIKQRDRAARKCQKYSRMLNTNLDVFTFRKEMSDI